MNSNLKAVVGFVLIVLAIGLVGRWDYEDQVAMSVVTFARTPADSLPATARFYDPVRESGLHFAIYRQLRSPVAYQAVTVYRCVQIN
jgi:hypothetical protein